jgi:hypothetical protein
MLACQANTHAQVIAARQQPQPSVRLSP